MQARGFAMAGIVQVSFNKIAMFDDAPWEPRYLCFEETAYRVDSWDELLQIFFYELYQGGNGSDELEHYVNNEGALGAVYFRDARMLKFASHPLIKFAPDLYMEVPNRPVTILRIIEKFRASFSRDHGAFDIYLAQTDEVTAEEITAFEKERFERKRAIKKGKRYVAHINSLILTPQERLFRRINEEFTKKTLIGDIVLDEEEKGILLEYMKEEFAVLKSTARNFEPTHPRVFTLGMVLYAQEHYREGNFWSGTESAFGTKIDPNRQRLVNKACNETLQAYGKARADDKNNQTVSICLHSFVSTPCANQFFDYLFDYWRLDLNRDVRNLDGDDGKDVFDILIDEIKGNNEQGVNNLMVHTSLALIKNPRGAKIRLRNYLKLIDGVFYGDCSIPNTDTRLIRLLKEWTENPKGRFQGELRHASAQARRRGETLLRKPTFLLNLGNGSFSLGLPRQILKDCSTEDALSLCWIIESDAFGERRVQPVPLKGKAGVYAEKAECSALALEDIFHALRYCLSDSRGKVYLRGEIEASDVRFFDNAGRYIDYGSGFLPDGTIYVAYKGGKPYVLGRKKNVGGSYASGIDEIQLEKGEVVVLPSGIALLAGRNGAMDEGLLLQGFVGEASVDGLPIYKSCPLVFFRSKQEGLSGSVVLLNDRRFRLSDIPLQEIKLADSIDDVFGYVLDLSSAEFGLSDGRISFSLWLGQRRRINKRFYLLSGFEYEFLDSPYVFKESGRIAFPAAISIINRGKNWEFEHGKKILSFRLDPSDGEASGFSVAGKELIIPYRLNGDEINVRFAIPALFWRFNQDDEWNFQRPADVFYQNIPDYIYVEGPFENDDISLVADLTEQDIERDGVLPFEGVQRRFRFSEIKSWILDRSCDAIRTFINMGGARSYVFLAINCHGKVNSSDVYGDFDENKIIGNLDISGAGDYTISLSGPGLDLKEIPSEAGRFEISLDSPLKEGIYSLNIFETEEDDFGWGEPLEIPLLEEPIKFSLKDITRLEGTSYRVCSYSFLRKSYYPCSIADGFVIRNLKRQNVEEWLEKDDKGELELLFDRKDEIDWKKSVLYVGDLANEINKQRLTTFNILLLFPNKLDPSDRIVLKLEEDRAINLYYNLKSRMLVADSDYGPYGANSALRYRDIMELFDRDYRLDLKVME